MGFDDMSDEDKQSMLDKLNGSIDKPAPASKPDSFSGFSADQQPSFASQHVSPDVQQSVTGSENKIDSDRQARLDAIKQMTSGGLTPEVQKIAEGMGGMGSIAVKGAAPIIAEAAPFLRQVAQKAAPAVEEAAQGVFPTIQKMFKPTQTVEDIKNGYGFLQKTGQEAASYSPGATGRAQQAADLENQLKTMQEALSTEKSGLRASQLNNAINKIKDKLNIFSKQ